MQSTSWTAGYVRWMGITALSFGLLGMSGCGADKDTESSTVEFARETRLTRVQVKASEAPKEEEEEFEAESTRHSSGGTGTAMALDEGKMGRQEAARASGQYAMKNQGYARQAGVVGALRASEAGSFASLTGGADFSSGLDPSAITPEANSESYTDYGKNPMVHTAEDRLSTFAIDVDTASYAIARKKILTGSELPPGAVRVEEFLNYFRYEYAGPEDERPFAVHMDAAPSPFAKGRHILRVAVQAKKLSNRQRKPANLVFLVDVSGSMSSADKLGLAKRALRILVDNLRDGDTVALVTYAGRVSVELEPTGLEHKGEILTAISRLSSGGSTAMGSGIELAYEMAARNLSPGTVSRVIVLSDGDANVGKTSHESILETIAGHVKEGVTLSTVGFGMGNYKDTMMEQLADKGNGNYHYIDGISQARRVFQEQLGSVLEVVAKDVKIQVDFDPEVVSRYRLIGYENRNIADHQFRNDRVDAGEIGAGHSVTALYEVELDSSVNAPPAVVRIRAKKPRGERARESVYGFDLDDLYTSFVRAPNDFRFASAVMGAAEILRKSEHAHDWRLADVIAIAEDASTETQADRQEFIALMRRIQPRLAAAR